MVDCHVGAGWPKELHIAREAQEKGLRVFSAPAVVLPRHRCVTCTEVTLARLNDYQRASPVVALLMKGAARPFIGP